MLSKKSIFHPLRHKRATFVVACLASLACGFIMGKGETYSEVFARISEFATNFIDLIKSHFA